VEIGRFKGQFIVNALFVAFLVSGTAIVSVGLGVLGAYYAIAGLLAAVNPARPAPLLRALVPHQGQVSGD
jgi:hypothetical protein